MNWSDEQIKSLLRESKYRSKFDVHAVVETMCDTECAAGEYEGCSTDLELAWTEYQSRVEQIAAKLSDWCRYCESPITLAEDGAWEDSSGACGCGRGEHEPGPPFRDIYGEAGLTPPPGGDDGIRH